MIEKKYGLFINGVLKCGGNYKEVNDYLLDYIKKVNRENDTDVALLEPQEDLRSYVDVNWLLEVEQADGNSWYIDLLIVECISNLKRSGNPTQKE